jgi:hypothetical protein
VRTHDRQEVLGRTEVKLGMLPDISSSVGPSKNGCRGGWLFSRTSINLVCEGSPARYLIVYIVSVEVSEMQCQRW